MFSTGCLVRIFPTGTSTVYDVIEKNKWTTNVRGVKVQNPSFIGNLGSQISNLLLVSSASSSDGTSIMLSLILSFVSSSVHSAYAFSLIALFAPSVDTESTSLSLFALLASSYNSIAPTYISWIAFLVPLSSSHDTVSTSTSTVFSLLVLLYPYCATR